MDKLLYLCVGFMGSSMIGLVKTGAQTGEVLCDATILTCIIYTIVLNRKWS